MRYLGSAVTALAVAGTCLASLRHPAKVAPTVPVALVVASALLWPQVNSRRLAAVQRFAAMYMCLVPLARISNVYISLTLAGLRVALSAGLLFAGALGVGYLLSGVSAKRLSQAESQLHVLLHQTWGLALIVLVVHQGFLWALLRSWYGYGYERGLHMFGLVSMHMLASMFLWMGLERPAPRRCACIALFGYYTALTAGIP
jgi:hypothetical protein